MLIDKTRHFFQQIGLLTFLKIILFLLFLGFLIIMSNQRTKVLIIYPSHYPNSIIQDMRYNIDQILSKNPSIKVFHHNINPQNYVIKTSKQKIEKKFFHELLLIETINPDVIIVFDALGRHIVQNNLFKKSCILFVGNRTILTKKDIAPYPNVTGLIECLDFEIIKSLFFDLYKNRAISKDKPLRIAYFGDESEESSYTENMLHNHRAWGEKIHLYPSVIAKNWEIWQKNILQNYIEYDIILVCFYDKLESMQNENVMNKGQSIISWTTGNTKIPILGLNLASVLDGGMLMVTSSPISCSKKLAGWVLDIVNQKIKPENLQQKIPCQETDHSIVYANKDALKKINMDISNIYYSSSLDIKNYLENTQ